KSDVQLSGGERQKCAIRKHDVDREQHHQAFEITAHMPCRADCMPRNKPVGRINRIPSRRPKTMMSTKSAPKVLMARTSATPMMIPPAIDPQTFPMPPTIIAEMPFNPTASPMKGCTCR